MAYNYKILDRRFWIEAEAKVMAGLATEEDFQELEKMTQWNNGFEEVRKVDEYFGDRFIQVAVDIGGVPTENEGFFGLEQRFPWGSRPCTIYEAKQATEEFMELKRSGLLCPECSGAHGFEIEH